MWSVSSALPPASSWSSMKLPRTPCESSQLSPEEPALEGLHCARVKRSFSCFLNAKKTPAGDNGSKLFTLSQPFTSDQGDLAWLLTRVSVPEATGNRRVTDALAVAGIEAATGGRPRAVILVLGHDATDTSAYQVEEVRQFLRDLRVPLWIWWTGRPSAVTVSEGRRPVRVDTVWGKAIDISSFNRIEQAVTELRKSLDRQHTVWVQGSHLPHRIELTSKATRAEFAGQD